MPNATVPLVLYNKVVDQFVKSHDFLKVSYENNDYISYNQKHFWVTMF